MTTRDTGVADADTAQTGAPSDREKGNRTMLIALILASVTLAAVGQITLKMGVDRVSGGALSLSGNSIKGLASSPVVWAGLIVFGLSAVVWLFALSRANLSYAYPFASLSYVIILANSVLVLHEDVRPLSWAGVALIIVGIVLVAQQPHNA